MLHRAVALALSGLAALAVLAGVLGLVFFTLCWATGHFTTIPLVVASAAAVAAHFLLRWAPLAQARVAASADSSQRVATPPKQHPAAPPQQPVATPPKPRRWRLPPGLASTICASVLLGFLGLSILWEHGVWHFGEFYYLGNWRWAGGTVLVTALVVLIQGSLESLRTARPPRPEK